jgi:ABC-type spermidine/putrescine transport system permease subunit II
MQNLAEQISEISPTNALFSAFLGYNPMGTILNVMDSSVVASIPQSVVDTLTSNYWFPETLQQAFMPALRVSFIIGAFLSAIAALLSAMRGQHYVHELQSEIESAMKGQPFVHAVPDDIDK